MKYASIRNFDISNGADIGVALFVQGCTHHCFNCFNPETWDFNGGKDWTKEVEDNFLKLLDRPYIKRVSILGGEPLEQGKDLYNLLYRIRQLKPIGTKNFAIWLYTGYKFDDPNLSPTQNDIISSCDIVVDGEYKDELRDLTLYYRGSSNQRIIDVQKSFQENKICEIFDFS